MPLVMQLQMAFVSHSHCAHVWCRASCVPCAHLDSMHFGEKTSHGSLQASEDSLSVSYKFPAASVKPGSYVSLTACYTNFSTYDRPWRKPNAMDFRVSLHC